MGCIAIRYLISLMVCLAFTIDSATRSAMNITIIAMVSNGTVINGTTSQVPLDWDATVQGYVLNSVYVGILVSQIPAGHLAESFSLKWVLGYGMFIMSVLTALTPIVARWNVYAFILARVIGGVAVGVAFPSANSLMSRWSPLSERTKLITIALQGYSAGAVLGSAFVGPVCDYLGWPFVFYILGGVGIVWSIIWYLVVASSPEKHWWISEEEMLLILNEREGNFNRDRHIPWQQIVTSMPVLILCFRTFCANVMYAIFFTYLPSFLDHMYHISLSVIGWIIGVSNVTTMIVAIICSGVADRLMQNGFTVDQVRKTFATLSMILPGVGFIVLTQLESNIKVMAVVIVVICTVWGSYGGSDTALPIDLAAEYAGAVSALQNVFATLALIVVPFLVGPYIETKEDLRHWNVIFLSGAAFAFVGALVFLAFGTAKKQNFTPTVVVVDEDVEGLIEPL